MTERIKWFKDISKDDVEVVGGKGANLGEMSNAGLPIPPGFVVTAQTYKEFIEKTKIKDKILDIIKDLDVEDTAKLQATAKQIQELIKKTEIPEEIKEDIKDNYGLIGTHRKSGASEIMEGKEEFVACRSSATAEDLPEASFAGQQATFLNIKGKDDVVQAVRECWASLFTARAIYYRKRNNFPTEKVYIAVVVQKMVNSDKSGVMFSINPATNNDTEIMIEGAFGLGEAVVSGSVNPDLYIVDKKSLKIKKVEIKEQKIKIIKDPETGKTVTKKLTKDEEAKQVCNDKEIRELARLAKKIEKHYGKPQDMEWAVEGENVYIVQARAVTTFKKPEKKKPAAEGEGLKEVEAESLVKGETASPGVASGTVKIIKDIAELDKIQKGDIMVTTMTTPDMVPAMQKANAIVTNEGGMTCHAAIVSREMGTPCIVGTGNGTEVLKEGQEVTVHATHGIVYAGKLEEVKPKVEAAAPAAPAQIITATQVKVIMDLPDFAEKAAAETNADGVGLVRLEIMIAQGGIHPAEYIRTGKREDYIKLLMNGIRGIAKAFHGKPVWIRTSDMRTDEYRNLKGADKEPKETDPMIGWHAIRRALDEPEILKAEFEAVKRLHDEGLKNVGVMIPFVIRTREVREAKKIMRGVGLEPCEDVQFGVMIETPASCWVIEDICKEGINFISFGTNDLTQLTLGIDRNNERIAKLFDEMHAAVLGEMKMVIETCKKHNVMTSICGQAGSRPEMAKFLVKVGIDSISANPDAVYTIRETVARTEKALLLEAEREEIEEREAK
ncbi:phosphoenolpyruvate synthase [Candidatus Woesearchaeota archaeon]|nr:phosphoenolpyruvate synthase [Candidatus Woesearchaeota archaeon]